MFKKTFIAALCSLTPLAAFASEPQDHAPIGVMGDHVHHKGEWMLGYHFKRIGMKGIRNGRHSVETTDVLHTYGEAHTRMDMDMQMLEIMYGVSDRLTLMVMPHYMKMDMTHAAHSGFHSHSHSTEGFGDTEVTGLYSVYQNGSHKIHLNMGVSLPTGSIDETFTNHHDVTYPQSYGMQFGSGTFDPIIGATYTGSTANWAWGAQTINTIRMGKNNNGYRLGNEYTATGWVARQLTDFASLSLRVEGEAWRNVEGRDIRLPLTIIAGGDPDEVAGERILANIGLNLLGTQNHGVLEGHRLAVEFGAPVYERYSGPQTETDYRLTIAWQKAF